MDEQRMLAERFDADRPHLRSVAYRMLGSLAEADDAVQDAWLKLSRADTSDVDNLTAWLTTVVARVCLDRLRTRTARREDPFAVHLPDPIITLDGVIDPEAEAVLADSVGLALLVVLETLSPAERLSFVLHDLFALPFDEIASIAGRTPEAARQLASRGRRRVQGNPVLPDVDVPAQRRVVDAFFAASRDGDFDALVAVLDPDVVLRSDGGTARPESTTVVEGAVAVATGASRFRHLTPFARPVLVNGVAGVIVILEGETVPFSLLAFTVVDDKVAAIDILADPDRLAALDLRALA
jgi:RNA polymerase sigma-70 factor (ECF subfamily)